MSSNRSPSCSGHASGALLLALLAAAPASGQAEPTRPLRIVQRDEPRLLDPHLDPTAAGSAILFNVFDGLVQTDADGGSAPALAVGWEPAGTFGWRFELRPDVRFHDGRPLGTADVVASLTRARDHPRSRFRKALEGLGRVEAVGDRAVEVEAGEPARILFRKLAAVKIVPGDSPETIVDPVGTGPYRVAAHEPRSHLRLEAFAGYWRDPAREPAVEILFEEDDEEAVRRLRDGEVDIVAHLPPSEVATLEADRRLWVASKLGGDVTNVVLNPDRPPFDDPLLRQAVDLALDREAIAAEVYSGYARAASQLAGPLSFGFVEGLPPVQRDLETARLLVQLSSYRPEETVALETIASRADLAAVVVEQLAEVGIRLEMVLRPWPELLQRMLDREPQAFLVSWSDGPLDVTNTLATIVHSDQALVSYGSEGPVLDRVIEGIFAATDLEARRRLAAVALERVAAARAFVPLVWRLELYGVRREIRWEPRPYAPLDLYTIARPGG